MGNVNNFMDPHNRRETRSCEGIDVEMETISKLRSKKLMEVVATSELKEIKTEKEGRELRSKKRKVSSTESIETKEEGRVTRSRGKRASISNHDQRDSARSPPAKDQLSSKQCTKSEQNEETRTEKQSALRSATQSRLASEITVTSPIYFRPFVGQWKGPALIAHVDTQHARQSLFFQDMHHLYRSKDTCMEASQLYFSFKILDNIPDDNIVYRLSATELLDDYEDLTKRNCLIEKVNFGNTIESALSAIQRKLQNLDQYDAIGDTDIEEEMREYKRSLKSLAALRESECLVRFREMEQDKEHQMRQLNSGVQTEATPMQMEVLELCDRKIWWVTAKEWLNGSERSCMFGAKCALCSRKVNIMKNPDNARAPAALKMPRVSIFNPADHEEPVKVAKEAKKADDVRRYNIRSIEMQKKASITRLELQRLHASLSFVDQYNSTGGQFLHE